MKRLIMMVALLLGTATMASAQNYMVIDSEKVFKSIPEYNTSIETLNKLAKSYQSQSEANFKEVENLFNAYNEQKQDLSLSRRQSVEARILQLEKEANEFQEGVFGENGSLMKKRLEMIQPIQKRVFDALQTYATLNGFDMVLDSAQNPTLLYSSPKVNHTEQFIKYLK